MNNENEQVKAAERYLADKAKGIRTVSYNYKKTYNYLDKRLKR